MKICTITCHDVYNHGAVMQAYALMKYLKNNGHEVKIIDYKPEYLSNHYNMLSVDNPKWGKNIYTKYVYLALKMPKRLISLKRKNEFDKFKHDNLVLTKIRYKSNEELKKNMPNADVYICGSDQIWNTLHENGKDLAFYLDFVPDNKIKLAYAASFATDNIDNKYKPMIKEKVSRLDGVGIREESGVELIKQLGIENALNVVDPVFLLDRDEWDEIGNEIYKDRYILVYDFDGSDLIKMIAKELANKLNLKIYTINNRKLGYENRSFQYRGPKTFVSLIKNAEFVISNSFHAVAFSIIYKKQICVVNREEDINTRMRDLLKLLNLNERLINNKTYSLNRIMNKIDYKKVDEELVKSIKISKEYLENILNTSINGEKI